MARELEPVAARGWPAAECDEIGGWRLHAASGFSGRINACWPLDDPGLPVDDAVQRTERWYSTRDLPTRFKIVEGTAPVLVSHLAARGYQAGDPTLVMVGDVTGTVEPGVRTAATLDADFLKVFAASQAAVAGDARERLEALERVSPPRFFAAVGACAVEEQSGWVSSPCAPTQIIGARGLPAACSPRSSLTPNSPERGGPICRSKRRTSAP